MDALVEDLACPSNCLHFLLNVDWKTSFQHIHKSSWNSKLKDVIHAYIAKKEESTKILKCYHSVDMPDEFLDPITMVPMKVRSTKRAKASGCVSRIPSCFRIREWSWIDPPSNVIC